MYTRTQKYLITNTLKECFTLCVYLLSLICIRNPDLIHRDFEFSRLENGVFLIKMCENSHS